MTEIGCGHAGHEAKDIALLFKDAICVKNIYLPDTFWQVLNHSFSERLKFIISHYAITPMVFIDKAAHVLNLIWGTEYPSVNDIQKILIKYPEVNARCLLFGERDLFGSN